MSTLSGHVIFSLLACHYLLLQYFVFRYKWSAQRFLRNAYSSGSTEGRPPRPSSMDSLLCVGLGLIYGWALPSPRIGSTGSILCSDLTSPTIHTHTYIFLVKFYTFFLFFWETVKFYTWTMILMLYLKLNSVSFNSLIYVFNSSE